MIVENGVVANTNQTCNQVEQLLLDRRVNTNPLLLGTDILGLRGPSVTGLINLSPLYLVDRLFLGPGIQTLGHTLDIIHLLYYS